MAFQKSKEFQSLSISQIQCDAMVTTKGQHYIVSRTDGRYRER